MGRGDIEELLESFSGEGNVDSSGKFTLDLARMAQVLQRFQLKRPREFILRAVASAVASGATWFEHKQVGGVLRLSWDGQPYTLEELENLWANLASASSPPRLQELAIALNTARKLGAVHLRTPVGEMLLEGLHICVDPGRLSPHTTLELRQPLWAVWLSRLTSPSTKALLGYRASLAPLEFRPHLRPPWTSHVTWAIRFGEPPTEAVEAKRFYQRDLNPEWGSGYLYLGDERPSRIQQLGVRITPPALPHDGLRLCWWTGALPLDLSRRQLQEETSEAWIVGLSGAMVEVLLERSQPSELDCLVACGLRSRHPAFMQAPLFRCGDGTPVSFGELQSQAQRDGYVFWQTKPGPTPCPPETILFVHKPYVNRLRHTLPFLNADCLVGHDHLKARLPDETKYLVSLPLPQGRGEAGLREALTMQYRSWKDDRWETVVGQSADIAIASGEPDVQALYQALTQQDDATAAPPSLTKAMHLVFYLYSTAAGVNLISKSKAEPLLSALFAPRPTWRYPARGLAAAISQSDLMESARSCRFQTFFSETQSLWDLYSKGGTWNYVTGPWCAYDQNPHQPLLVLPSNTLHPLAKLLRDRCQFQEQQGRAYVSKTLQAAWEACPVTPAAACLHTLYNPASSAHQIALAILGEEGLLDLLAAPTIFQKEVEPDYADEVLRQAWIEVGPARHLSSEVYLLGLLQAQTPFAQQLQARGLTVKAVRERVLSYRHHECLTELETRLPTLSGDERRRGLQKRVIGLLRAERHPDEAGQALQALQEEFPDHPDTLLALSEHAVFGGEALAAISHLEQALAKEPTASTWVAYGETLRFLGDRAGAREASLQMDDPKSRGQLLALQASVCDNPDETLRLCSQARQWPDCPLSISASEGWAYHLKGMTWEAQQAFQRFLKVRLDQCFEADLLPRQAKVRELLAAPPPP